MNELLATLFDCQGRNNERAEHTAQGKQQVIEKCPNKSLLGPLLRESSVDGNAICVFADASEFSLLLHK